MAASASVQGGEAGRDWSPNRKLRREIETISEPVLVYLPGGRIAAVNRAARKLADFDPVDLTIVDLMNRYGARHPNGDPVNPGDLPYARALRGEEVTQGERFEMCLPDGSIYVALITSRPIIVDGKVVGALSIWHDFAEYTRRLALSITNELKPTRR